MINMSSLKIGFDAKRACVNQVGLGSYSRNVIKSILSAKPEWDVYLFSPDKPLDKYSSIYESPNSHLVLPKSDFVIKSVWRNYTVSKLAYDLNLDLFHGLSHAIPHNLKIPSVTTFHDLIFMHHPEWFGFFNARMYHKEYLRAALHTDHIISISEATKKDLIDIFKIPEDKITVTYQSCNPAFRVLSSDELRAGSSNLEKYNLNYKSYFLFVGTLEKRKNILRLTQAYSRLSDEQRKKFPLVFVGNHTKEVRTLEAYIKQAGIEEEVKFLSYIEFDELVYLMNSAKVIVYPALIEGFGLPVLEGMSCGTPVLTSNNSSLAEVGGDCSYLVDPTSLDSISLQLDLILSDNDKYIKKCNDIPMHIRKFSNEETTKKVIEAYNKVLKF